MERVPGSGTHVSMPSINAREEIQWPPWWQSLCLCVCPLWEGTHIFLREVFYSVSLLLDPFHLLPSISFPFFSIILSLYFHCSQAAHSEIVTELLSMMNFWSFKEYFLGEDGGKRAVLDNRNQNAHGRQKFSSSSLSHKTTATVPTQAKPANVAHEHASLASPGSM